MPKFKDDTLIPGIPDKDIVETINRDCPGYDKYLHAKVKRPAKYGVMLSPEGRAPVKAKYGADVFDTRRKSKPDGHRYTRRAECRLSDSEMGKLQLTLNSDPSYSCSTCQPRVSVLVHDLLSGYIKQREREESGEVRCKLCDTSNGLIHMDGSTVCVQCAMNISVALKNVKLAV